MVHCCFTSTETARLIRMGSPGRPPRLSHSLWTLRVLQESFIIFVVHWCVWSLTTSFCALNAFNYYYYNCSWGLAFSFKAKPVICVHMFLSSIIWHVAFQNTWAWSIFVSLLCLSGIHWLPVWNLTTLSSWIQNPAQDFLCLDRPFHMPR